MEQHRIVKLASLKQVSEDQRIIEGIATSSKVDRVGDIVESKGAVYRLPLPLLLDHDSKNAVGSVTAARITDAGIKFQARIEKIAEPGYVQDLCNQAWSLVKNGLRRSVSIGFRALPGGSEKLTQTGGTRFSSWEWLELSLVSIPAHDEANITVARSAGVIGKDITVETWDRNKKYTQGDLVVFAGRRWTPKFESCPRVRPCDIIWTDLGPANLNDNVAKVTAPVTGQPGPKLTRDMSRYADPGAYRHDG